MIDDQLKTVESVEENETKLPLEQIRTIISNNNQLQFKVLDLIEDDIILDYVVDNFADHLREIVREHGGN